MQKIDIQSWERKDIYQHFKNFVDPYFALVAEVDVTQVYEFSKREELSFFPCFLHCCMQAINSVPEFKYREVAGEVVVYDTIHASATMMRENQQLGFSFVNYNVDLQEFIHNYSEEKNRVSASKTLFPPVNSLDCIYCSAIPWVKFTGHKEPFLGQWESVPKLGFSKYEKRDNKIVMNVSVAVNHAFVDGIHVGRFFEKIQFYLNNIK